MSKIRSSVFLLVAIAVVLWVVVFILVHTNQVTHSDSSHNPLSIQSIIKSTQSAQTNSANIAMESNYVESPSTSSKITDSLKGTTPPIKKQIIVPFSQLKTKYNLLTIPTYDGSGQLTHPKVLYFANSWNGYHYWMSMTPYPNADYRYENPSIVVSNDGISWFVPTGLKNPISGIPSDAKYGAYYSDPHLVMNGKAMELWYRYNPGDPKTGHAHNNINIYYKKVSTDGIHWSAAKFLCNFGWAGHMSMAINCEDGIYKSWYADYDGHLYYSQSADSQNWSHSVIASVPLPAGYQSYHQDIIKVGSRYCLLQCAKKHSNNTFAQFFASSTDGIHFSNVKRIYPTTNTALWNNVSIYRSSMFEKDGKLQMYLALWFKSLGRTWYLTHQTFSLQNLLGSE
ncbi:MAG TPA: hypothetical protein VHO94_06560 [Oscillospiraceae bacterium]|nr:hypothetical protein [Oscillospiraceae bacterium]